jgi:predicted Zn finger-like uncharacterized protein
VSLATRCAACGTVFRVVPDQLRVSDGWVRCGRCDAVFDAAQSLFDIDAGTPVRLEGLGGSPRPPGEAAPTPTAAPSPAAPSRAAAATSNTTATTAAPDDDPLADVVPADWQQHQQRQELARRIAVNEESDARTLLRQAAEPGEDGAPAAASHLGPFATAADAGSGWRSALGGAPRPSMPAVAEAPTFLREAERAAFWQRPAVRGAAMAACVALAGIAVLQLALLWREPLASRVPALAGPLASLCRRAGCELLPPRRLDQLSVDSSGLNRVDDSPYYRFSALLRNRADVTLTAPALELSLTDNAGALIARRVFQLGDLGPARNTLDRGQEWPIQVLLSAGERRVEGYTLELFYP